MSVLYVSELTFPNSYLSEIAMLSFHIRNEVDLFQELVLTDVKLIPQIIFKEKRRNSKNWNFILYFFKRAKNGIVYLPIQLCAPCYLLVFLIAY